MSMSHGPACGCGLCRAHAIEVARARFMAAQAQMAQQAQATFNAAMSQPLGGAAGGGGGGGGGGGVVWAVYNPATDTYSPVPPAPSRKPHGLEGLTRASDQSVGDPTQDTEHYWSRYRRDGAAHALLITRYHQCEQSIHSPNPTPMGWRYWIWAPEYSRLVSPFSPAIWRDCELRARDFSPWNDCRNFEGIHALNPPASTEKLPHAMIVQGAVERFGRFVAGTTGWRAEIVVIRSLQANDEGMAVKLREAYPDVPVAVL